MSPEQGLLRQILIWLSDRHDDWLKNPGKALHLHEQVARDYPRIEISELENVTKTGKSYASGSRFIFLRPIEKHVLMQPIMTLSYDFSRKIPELHIELGLFIPTTDGAVAIGFRFETPEGTGGHNYYHSQLITSFRQPVQISCLPCPDWLPVSYPALVIDATNVVALMICVILSLYGRDYEKQLLDSKFGDVIRRYIGELGWNDGVSGKHSRFVGDQSGKWFLKTRQ